MNRGNTEGLKDEIETYSSFIIPEVVLLCSKFFLPVVAYLLNPSNLVYLLVIPNGISEYGDLRHKPRTIANFLHSLDLDSYLCQTIVKVQVNLTPRQASSAYRVAIILIV